MREALGEEVAWLVEEMGGGEAEVQEEEEEEEEEEEDDDDEEEDDDDDMFDDADVDEDLWAAVGSRSSPPAPKPAAPPGPLEAARRKLREIAGDRDKMLRIAASVAVAGVAVYALRRRRMPRNLLK
jgi:hypothetical protein